MEAPPDTAPPRRYARQPRKYPLSTVARPFTPTPSLPDRALAAIAPWHKDDYPGLWKVWRAMSGTSPRTLHGYRKYRTPSVETLERIEAFLASRRDTINAVLAEIKAAKLTTKESPKMRGFCAVDSSGKDKRYRGRKTRRKK